MDLLAAPDPGLWAGRDRKFDRPPTREQFARELMGLPPEWQVFSWEAIGRVAGSARQGVIVKGAVPAQLIMRGKRKGQPNWKKLKPGTEMTVAVTENEFRPWLLLWERENGACFECAGTGRVFSSWDHIEGIRYRDCRRCNATGDFPNA